MAEPTVRTLNALLLTRLIQILLQKPNHPNSRADLGGTWLILDELHKLPPLPSLSNAILLGRAKSLKVVAGIQEISSVQAIYGDHVANALLGQLRNKVVLGLDSSESRDWASRLAGEWEGPVKSWSYNAQGDQTVNVTTQRRASILPAEFDLPLPDRSNGLSFFSFLSGIGVYKHTIDGKWLFDEALPRPDPREPDFIPRSPDCQELRPWSPEDWERLGMQDPPPFLPTAKAPPPPPTFPSSEELKLAALEVLKEKLRHSFRLELGGR